MNMEHIMVIGFVVVLLTLICIDAILKSLEHIGLTVKELIKLIKEDGLLEAMQDCFGDY